MTADGAARPRSLSGPIRGDRRSDPAWRPFVSARSRILGWSVALLAAAATATTIATHAFLVASMNSRVHSELTHEIAEFRALAARYGATRPAEPHEDNSRSHAARAITVTGLMRARTSSAVLENDTVLIGVIAGRIVTTSKNFNPADGPGPTVLARWSALTGPAAGTVVMARGPGRFQAIPVRLPGQRPATFVAVSLIASQQTGIDSITRLQILVGAIALLAGSALAWLIAGRVLRPVRDTTELARRITESDLSERIPARGSDEISALAVTFNRMLDRLESAMTAQRSFLADAGHELRTPITIIQGNLDTLSVTSADDAETLGIVADEIGRMSRMVDDLLLLASSERPDFLHPVPTDLGRLTRSLVAKARALDNRPWSMAGAAEQVVLLDRQRVTQAVMQLAANAVAHTPPGTPVEIGSRFTGQAVVFSVADRGPGIPATDRHRVLERFTRLEPGRTGGSGLGLAIVAAIAAAHDGHVDIGERDGGGTLVSLTLRCELAPAPAGQDRP